MGYFLYLKKGHSDAHRLPCELQGVHSLEIRSWHIPPIISLQSLVLGSYSDKNSLHKNLYEQAMRVAGSNQISKFEKWDRHICLFVIMVL